ncbi:phage tail assembly protein T [Psychrobacter nivimaris]|uniref:phage tail assembly protein T n=1 Tax=Psychrobacter nivimaris TaxID=281738 RepID=UPI0019199248|nr:phage tail protein [Psychrobacter nivimaris]
MTVAELSAKLSNDELIEWMAYYSFDPWGGYRSDVQTARLEAASTGYRGNLSEILAFEPDPLPPDEIKRREQIAQIAKLERQTAQMAAMFDDIE